MPFNLLTDPFFPIITSRAGKKWITFPELTTIEGDYPVDFNWPRQDFNIATYEFAIGVTTLALRPSGPPAWSSLWKSPPTPDDLREAIEPFVHAFNLDGDGPRFLQELGGAEGEGTPIEALLIDTPGANGQKKNADVLTHGRRYEALGPPAAAMALYALQQFAPSGGAGNRTSLRGGGPLTTLVLPGAPGGERPPLWRVILANLAATGSNSFDDEDLPRILPWLAPTLLSDKAHGERKAHQGDDDIHPLQAFFGMPRRMRLDFGGDGICPMTGEAGPLVMGFTQRPWGVNYGLWKHPLTPYRRQKADAEPFSVKPKSQRLGYRDWVAVTVGGAESGHSEPAPAIAAARKERAARLRGAADSDARLRAAGWAMNNMEAVAYLLAEQPLHLARDETAQALIDDAAPRMARAADIATTGLRLALRQALFAEGAKPATDTGVFDEAQGAFYEATEDAFHDALDAFIADPAGSTGALPAKWLGLLSRAALAAFAHWAPIPIDDAERARRVAMASSFLRSVFAGYGKLGADLFGALELPRPEVATPSKKGERRGKK